MNTMITSVIKYCPPPNQTEPVKTGPNPTRHRTSLPNMLDYTTVKYFISFMYWIIHNYYVQNSPS